MLSIAGIVTVIVGYIKLRPTVIRTRVWTPAEDVSILFLCISKMITSIERKPDEVTMDYIIQFRVTPSM